MRPQLDIVGEPRLELGTSASKADVLTNYTAFPNKIVVHHIKVTTTKKPKSCNSGESILSYGQHEKQFEVTLTFNKRIRREAQIRTGIADVSDPEPKPFSRSPHN